MSRPQHEPDYLTSVGTSERMLHSALLVHHEKHSADAGAILSEITKLREELAAAFDAQKSREEARVKQLESTRLWRFLAWLGLL